MSFRLQLFFYKNIGYSKRNHTLVLSLYRFFAGPKCYNKSLLQRRNCMKYKTSFQVAGSFFLVLFFILGWIVKFHLSWLSGFDQWFTGIVRASYPDLNSYQLFMTKFGNPLTVIILFACAALWMWYKKKGRNILVRFWIYCNCWNHQPGDQTIFHARASFIGALSS